VLDPPQAVPAPEAAGGRFLAGRLITQRKNKACSLRASTGTYMSDVLFSSASDSLLTPSATARLLEKSEGWVRRAADEGKLPCILASGGRRLFRRSDLESYQQRLAQQSSPAVA
jgi:hypothetical protein